MTASPSSANFLKDLRLLLVADATSTHTQRWAMHFRDRGCKVTVLSPLAEAVGERIDGVSVICFPGRRRWYHAIPKLRMLLDWPVFRRMLRGLQPQLVHFHFVSEGGRTFYWNGIKVPIICSTWGQDAIFDAGPNPRAQSSLRNMLRRSLFVTATTHQLARATAAYVAPGKPIYVIPFGVQTDQFTLRQPPAQSGPVVLGFVKHLLPKYGPDVLLEAFAVIHQNRPQTRLILAGRGSMRDQLEHRAHELGVAQAVEFCGRVAHQKVPQLMRSLDLLVMPSVYESETFGVAAIEASACGVAVVASRVGGVGEAVRDGQTGLLVHPGDAAALASACLQLIDDPQRRWQMGLAGRRFVERYYRWADNTLQMEEVYRAALSGTQPQAVTTYQPGIEPTWDMDGQSPGR